MWIRYGALIFVGMSSGIIVAGSFVAVVVMLGVIPRLAGETKTIKKAMLYENLIILGVVFGNVVSLYRIPIPIGTIGAIIMGVFSGIYIGCLAMALEEVVRTWPILSRRIKLRKGMPFVVYALALGKGIGSFIQFFIG